MSAVRDVLLGLRYQRSAVDELARSIDMERRCCGVAMEEMLDWVHEQQHPITVFDFSDWCEARRTFQAVEKVANGSRTASTD
jgi:hypothetical protein